MIVTRRITAPAPALCAFVLLGACTNLTLPEGLSGFGMGGDPAAQTAVQPTADRPEPDARGVISYPNYQVAVARPNDTVGAIARRLDLDAAALARTNGLPVDRPLRGGELILLNERVPVVASADDAATEGEVDVATLAGSALDRAEGTAPAPAPSGEQETIAAPAGPEPRRHRVERGETAFSIARQYDVSVRALAEWNGLDSALTVREGQTLLIPVATGPAPEPDGPTAPGAGSPTPEPPSAAAPQPDEALPSAAAAAAAEADPDPAISAPQTSASDTARLRQPVTGSIIRAYAPGTNEGVDFGAPAGAPVVAAEAGTVAAITQDTDQVPIIVLRHANNLLTVYANVDGIVVERGTQVARGQRIAEVRGGDPAFLHFEVRQGFESVDPVPYLTE